VINPILGPIAVIAPSSAFDPDKLAVGLAMAREQGLDVQPLPNLLDPVRTLAHSDAHRAAQLIEALTSDRYGAVWMVRGGYGLTRILDRLDGVSLPPRPILGFSDVTALFAALHPRGVGPLIHAPMPHSLASNDAESQAHLWDLVAGRPTAPMSGTEWVAGEADGPLVGGNLTMLATLCGTPWQLDASGSILVLEDVGEYPYRLDRALQQISSAGGFDGVAGIALGEFSNCWAPEGADWTLDDVLLDHLGPLGVPIVADLPIGHGTRNLAFVWGETARLHQGTLR